MKKLIRKISVSSLMLFAMAIGRVQAAPAGGTGSNLDLTENVCRLVTEMGGLFRTLRALAFVGAAFIIAGWAWEYISSGKVELKDVKEKGIGMLVGFLLLFFIGTIITIFMPGNGICEAQFGAW